MKITMNGSRFSMKLDDIVREQFFIYDEHIMVRLRVASTSGKVKCFDFNIMDTVELSGDIKIEPVEAELLVNF